jgi:outer membrane protein assembly factor BamA
MKKLEILIIFIMIIPLLSASGSEHSKQWNRYFFSDFSEELSVEKEDASKDSLMIFPVIYYTPETEIAGGILGGYYFYPSENPDYSKPSAVTLELLYTGLDQFKGEITFDVFKSFYKERITGAIGYSKFPSKFWGIGNYTKAEDETLFTPKSFWVNLSYKFLIVHDLYIGLEYELNLKDIIHEDQSSGFDLDLINGVDGGLVSRIGFSISDDTRDHLIYPGKGAYYQGQFMFSNRILGSDFDFTSLKIDLRNYFTLFEEVVIAGQLVGSFNWGDIPFFYSSFVGGKYLMRGFYEGRYRDNDMIAIQGECRIPLWWRIGIVVFAGVAQTADIPGDFRFDAFKVAFGGGVRLLWDKEQKLNIRLDVGFAEGETSLYVTIGEAF